MDEHEFQQDVMVSHAVQGTKQRFTTTAAFRCADECRDSMMILHCLTLLFCAGGHA